MSGRNDTNPVDPFAQGDPSKPISYDIPPHHRLQPQALAMKYRVFKPKPSTRSVHGGFSKMNPRKHNPERSPE